MRIKVTHCRTCKATGTGGQYIHRDDKGPVSIKNKPCPDCDGTGHIVEVVM